MASILNQIYKHLELKCMQAVLNHHHGGRDGVASRCAVQHATSSPGGGGGQPPAGKGKLVDAVSSVRLITNRGISWPSGT
jgi:hypothetical protein